MYFGSIKTLSILLLVLIKFVPYKANFNMEIHHVSDKFQTCIFCCTLSLKVSKKVKVKKQKNIGHIKHLVSKSNTCVLPTKPFKQIWFLKWRIGKSWFPVFSHFYFYLDLLRRVDCWQGLWKQPKKSSISKIQREMFSIFQCVNFFLFFSMKSHQLFVLNFGGNFNLIQGQNVISDLTI